MNPLNHGFKIKNSLDLQNWKTLEIDNSVDLEIQSICPGNCGELKTICTLVGNEGAQRIRIGNCRTCGYLGYIDRPSAKWMNDFYLSEWDEAGKNVEKKSERLKNLAMTNNFGSEKEIVALIKNHPVDKSRYICEIGCGFGNTLKQIQESGFSKVVGVEHSKHRAEIAKRAYKINVLVGAFESKNVQDELRSRSPLSLIFAYHVIEHTYNPSEIIKLCSTLQRDGDFLGISVPNVAGESSMAILTFLPHLHSFSRNTIEKILANNGYQIVDDYLSDNSRLNLLAKKVSKTNLGEPTTPLKIDGPTKLRSALHLPVNLKDRDYRIWFSKNDRVGIRPHLSLPILEKVSWKIFTKLNKVGAMNSLIIRPLSTRYTSYEDSPIEIQFEGKIKLFYK